MTAVRIFAVGGDLDTTFNTGAAGFSQTVNAIAVQTDGRVLIGGSFSVVNGRSYNFLARLNTNGTIDQSFNIGTGFNNIVGAIAVQADGRILVGGQFSSFNGTSQSRFLRLNADDSLDSTFNVGTGPNGQVDVIVVQTDGRILAGGFFGTFNGVSSNEIARLNADGTRDPGFNVGTGFSNSVNAFALQTDGRILCVGNFVTFNGVTRRNLARLNTDGSLDASFRSGAGINNNLEAVGVQADGRIVIGGNLQTYDNIPKFGIARVSAGDTLT